MAAKRTSWMWWGREGRARVSARGLARLNRVGGGGGIGSIMVLLLRARALSV